MASGQRVPLETATPPIGKENLGRYTAFRRIGDGFLSIAKGTFFHAGNAAGQGKRMVESVAGQRSAAH